MRRRNLAVAGAAVLALGGFVLFWFQPQKLWIDERASERSPRAQAEAARGEFVSLDHSTTGLVRVLVLSDGRRVARIEGLDTSNGPDVYVYLTANRADGPEEAFDDEYANLGRLEGNRGDQNYDVPAGVDLARLSTVVIWCDRFDSAFGAADLSAPA